MKQETKTPRALLKRPIYWIQLAFGLLLYLGILYLSGVNLQTLDFLKDLDWTSLFISLLLTILLTAFISIRWSLIANGLAGYKALSQLESFFYVLAGRTVGFVLPKDLSDMAVRTLFLARRNQVPVLISTSSLILDKMLDLIVSLVFLLPALLFVFQLATIPEALLLLVTLSAAVFLLLRFGSNLVLGLFFYGYNLLAGVVFRVLRREFKRATAPAIASSTFSLGYLASLAKQICIGLRAYFFGQAVGISLSPLVFLFAASITQMSYVVSVTPDGLGIYDGAWYAVINALTSGEQPIDSFLILQRVFTIVVIGGLTLLTFGVVSWRKREKDKAGVESSR